MAKAKKSETAPASYTVVARRYRPKQLNELIGQEHVAEALTNALKSGRIAHAYLFTGARGTGKTSCARILAKCLTCEKGPTPRPCDQCEICKGVMSGDDVDIVEIDGASTRGIDDARELRQNAGFRPTRSRFKIYIIDEVHMLTREAFNALLKTLEEPPAHVKFIFATTEVQKIPITILSRCQRFDFAFVKPKHIFEHLRTIVDKEGLTADDDALHLIARRAAGSMRDSQSLLDQMMAFADGKLTAEKVHALLGTAGDDRVIELADLILKKDAKGAIEKVQAFADRGMQIGELLDQLIDHWRGLMLTLAAGPDFADLPGTPAYQKALKEHAKGQNLDTILAGLDVLTTAKGRTRGSPHVGTLLEMAVVRLARLDELLPIASLLTSGAIVKPTVPSDEASKKNSPLSPGGINGQPAPPAFTGDPEGILEFLKNNLGPMKGSLLGQAGPPAILGPNALAFRFPDRYSSAYEQCADERTVGQMLVALKKWTGRDWQVRIEAAEGKPAAEPPRDSATNRQKDLLKLPIFAKAVETFGAQLVRLDDGFEPVVNREEPTDDTP